MNADEQLTTEESEMKTKLIEVFRDNISGVQYGDYQQVLPKLKAGAKLTLTWERGNNYDPMAIRIDLDKVKLGYVKGNSEFQRLLHEYREHGIKVVATLVSFNRTNPTWQMLTYKIEAPSAIGAEKEERLT